MVHGRAPDRPDQDRTRFLGVGSLSPEAMVSDVRPFCGENRLGLHRHMRRDLWLAA
jgi:hypothetical protein